MNALCSWHLGCKKEQTLESGKPGVRKTLTSWVDLSKLSDLYKPVYKITGIIISSLQGCFEN